MASRHSVAWTSTAAADLAAIIEYIASGDRSAALKAFDRIEASAASFRFHPARGRFVPELRPFAVRVYREVVVAPWRIIYRMAASEVRVLAVLDGRRDLEDTLLERLLR